MSASSVESLSAKYETALAAHLDAPGDDRKRAAAATAAQKLADARAAERSARPAGPTVVADIREG